MKQFEDVVNSPHVAEIETKKLWLADFIMWTTKHCDENLAKKNRDQKECGMDMIYAPDGTTCTGEWVPNTIGLRDKSFWIDGKEECKPMEEGICRPVSQMHYEDLADLQAKGMYEPAVNSYCPVFRSSSPEKLKFCVEKWREMTGGGGNLEVVEGTDSKHPTCAGEYLTDGSIKSPIPISQGPVMFGKHLYQHEDTMDLIDETRAFCDDDPDMHCWMTGIPYDYWEQVKGNNFNQMFAVFTWLLSNSLCSLISQYLYVDTLLAEIGGYALIAVFCVSLAFLFLKVGREPEHRGFKAFAGITVGSLLIALTGLLSVITISGISSLANVSLTSFSVMSFVLSIGYTTEYSVHIIHRWLRAPMNLTASKDRVEHTMEFLFLPTFMSFVSSTIGVVCLAFTEFHFNEVYFFRPLIIVMFVTYFYGCYLLPFVLAVLDFEFLRLGPANHGESENELLGADKAVKSDDEVVGVEKALVRPGDDGEGNAEVEQGDKTNVVGEASTAVVPGESEGWAWLEKEAAEKK